MPHLANPAPIYRRRQLLATLLPWPMLLSLSAARAQGRKPGEVLIGGTGAGMGPLHKLLTGRPELRLMPNLGSGGGLKALAAGAIDIAVIARRLDDAERARGLVERVFFRTPVVWAVQGDVPLLRTTQTELAALYAGRNSNWSNGAPVRLVLRPESDSDTRFMRALSPAMAEAMTLAHARSGAHVAATDSDATEAIERITGALGISTLGLLGAEGRSVHVLELDGTKPALDTMASGRYAHTKTVYLATRGPAGAEVAAAISSILSARSAQLLAGLGCQALTTT